MDAKQLHAYFSPYKKTGEYIPTPLRLSENLAFIGHTLALLGSLSILTFFPFWHLLWQTSAVISGLNMLFILVHLTPPPCIVTPEKLFIAPSLLGKGPWIYWHEIADIIAYPTSIRIIPHSTIPLLKRRGRLKQFFLTTYWKLSKQRPAFSIAPFMQKKGSSFAIADLLIAFQKEGVKNRLIHPQLILFDCDGTLVDSELISYKIYSEIFAQEGYQRTPEELLKEFSGLSLATMIEQVSITLKRPLPPTIGERIHDKIVQAFQEKLHEITGIHQLLEELKQKQVPFCLVSNGLPKRIKTALESTNLSPFFTDTTIFDVEAAQKGKPAPDLLLFAAQMLNVAPEQCLVIEDSVTGIQAAHAAGMAVIALLAGDHTQADWYQEGINKAAPTFITHKTAEIIHLINR